MTGKAKPRARVALRPRVRKFAEQMELALRDNDHKGGWKECSNGYLLTRLREEADELEEAISCLAMPAEFYTGPYRQAFVIEGEAADVANFAMMIWDNNQPDTKGR